MYRASILLLLLVACSLGVPVVAKGKIAVPSGKLCKWGYERAKGFLGAQSGVKALTVCYPKPVYGSR